MKQHKNLGEWQLDLETHLIQFDERKAAALGYKMSEIPEYVTYDFFIDKIYLEDLSKVRDLFLELITGKIEGFDIEYRTRTKAGSSRWFREICKITTKTETGKPLMASGVTWDITDEKFLESDHRLENGDLDAIENEAMRVSDHLTQIGNRERVLGKLKKEAEKSHNMTMFLSVALCEIENIDQINAMEGHIFGDYLLMRIADLLVENVADNDNVGRYTPDQFMIIYPSTPREIATDRMKKMMKTIENYEFGSKSPIKMPFVVKEYMGEALEDFTTSLEQELMMRA